MRDSGHDDEPQKQLLKWYAEWGIDPNYAAQGSLVSPEISTPAREITLLQRKTTPLGKGLGKTSGWVHRLTMKKKGVKLLAGVSYQKIDDHGLHVQIEGNNYVLEVDNIVVCAGQLSVNDLYQKLDPYGKNNHVHLIGGAYVAAEVDAKRAIREGAELAARI